MEKAFVAVIADSKTNQIRHITLGNYDKSKIKTIHNWIKSNVEPGAILLMDSADHLNPLAADYNIMKVNHTAHEFIRRSDIEIRYRDNDEKVDLLVTNNAIEGFWARFIDQKSVTYQHRFDIKTFRIMFPIQLIDYSLTVC